MTGTLELSTTSDAAVNAALAPLRPVAQQPGHDPLTAAAALAVAHQALRVRLADAG